MPVVNAGKDSKGSNERTVESEVTGLKGTRKTISPVVIVEEENTTPETILESSQTQPATRSESESPVHIGVAFSFTVEFNSKQPSKPKPA